MCKRARDRDSFGGKRDFEYNKVSAMAEKTYVNTVMQLDNVFCMDN